MNASGWPLMLFDLKPLSGEVNGGEIGVTRAMRDAGKLPQRALMVGDQAVDVVAARAVGIRAAKVRWGYGSAAEIEAGRPDLVVATPAAWRPLRDGAAPRR